MRRAAARGVILAGLALLAASAYVGFGPAAALAVAGVELVVCGLLTDEDPSASAGAASPAGAEAPPAPAAPAPPTLMGARRGKRPA